MAVVARDLDDVTGFLFSSALWHELTPFRVEELHRTQLEQFEARRRQAKERQDLLTLLSTIADGIWEVAIIGVVAEALIELKLNSVREMLQQDSERFYKLVQRKFGQKDFLTEIRRSRRSRPAAHPQIPSPRLILTTLLGTATEMLSVGDPPICDWTDDEVVSALGRWKTGLDALKGFVHRAEHELLAERLCRLAYATGKVNQWQLASILDEPIEDVLFRLDRYDCKPPLASLELDEERRAEIVHRAMNQKDRFPSHTDDRSIRRSVVSSQRIEGIDARDHEI